MAILFWLLIKHFVCDFPLQMTPWMYRNKGTYGHPGGVAHAAIHSTGTLLVLLALAPEHAVLLAAFDYLMHYHVDYLKVRIGQAHNLKPDNSEWFWVLLGFDQLLHQLTYFVIVWIAT